MRILLLLALLWGPAHAESTNPYAMEEMSIVHKPSPCFGYYYCIAANKDGKNYLIVLRSGTKDIQYLLLIDGETPALLWAREAI